MVLAEALRVRRSHFLASVLATTMAPVRAAPAGASVLRLDASPSGHDVDPYRDQERGVDEIAWLYADGLIGWNGGPVPLLAAGLPESLHDGRRYRYRLRPARWHDGEPVLASHVAAAFDAVRDGAWGTYEPYRRVVAVEPTGHRTFDVVLRQPSPAFVRSFFGAYGVAALPLLRSRPGELPIGTGPFAVRERLDVTRWRLERVDGSPRGRARVGLIDVRYLYSRQTDYIALLSGETDIALPLPGRYPASPSFRRVRRTTGTTLMIFNAAGPFGDVRVRRAFAQTIDVAAVQRAYDPARRALFASYRLDGRPDASLAHMVAHDPRKANALKALLGDYEVRILTIPGTSVDIAMGLVRQTLVHAGISVRMLATPYGGLYGPTSPLRRGEFDLALNSYADVDAADLAADWSCTSRSPSGGNFARWCDPTLERAVAAPHDAAAFRRLYDQLAAVPMSRAYEDIGVSRRVCDFRAPPPLVPATYACTAWRVC